jgi:hypothetical protein
MGVLGSGLHKMVGFTSRFKDCKIQNTTNLIHYFLMCLECIAMTLKDSTHKSVTGLGMGDPSIHDQFVQVLPLAFRQTYGCLLYTFTGSG